MLNAIYLILALLATGVTFYYTLFYEVSIPGGQYHYTYAGLAFTAGLIFAALWLAGVINKDNSRTRFITE